MTRSVLKKICQIASGLSVLFLFITVFPFVACCLNGRLQMDLLLGQISGACIFALLAPFFSSLSRICTFDSQAERWEIAKELDRIALIFIIMTVAASGINAVEALTSGVTGGFSVTLGTPGITWGLIDIDSAADGSALVRVDAFGLILAGFSKALSLAFCDSNAKRQHN